MSLNDNNFPQFTLRQVGVTAHTPVRVCTTRYGATAKRVLIEGIERGDWLTNHHHYIEIAVPKWDDTCVLHTHAFYEIALFRQGRCVLTSPGGVEAELTRGDVLVMVPETVHGYHQPTPVCWTDLYLLPDWLLEDLRILWQVGGLVQHLLAHALFRSPATQKLIRLRTAPEETEAWEREIAQMEEESKQPQPCLATINGCLLKVLGTLNRAFLRSTAGRDTPMHPDVWRAAYCIEQSIRRGERFEPAALASQMAMSRRSVERLFRRWTAVTPLRYYQRRRIEHARRLLSDPRRSVTDVAHELGFADGPHFTKVFQQYTGATPTDYRRRQFTLVAPGAPRRGLEQEERAKT